jgi:hypothetical protein
MNGIYWDGCIDRWDDPEPVDDDDFAITNSIVSWFTLATNDDDSDDAAI